MKTKILFNSYYKAGNENLYFKDVLDSASLTGTGNYSIRCNNFFSEKYGINNSLLTTSCTSALEMAAILLNIKPGDEIIMPSYTYVSTANAFALRGAKIVFADSGSDNPNIDVARIEQLITKKTKAIVPVHYAGIACDMNEILLIAKQNSLFVIEDAAHAIHGYYNKKPLGTFGQVSTFSFHETKNITCGEGGMLVINDKQFSERAEVVIEKGTNRKNFSQGKTKKYEWVDLGSSYRLSELSAGFLFAQLEAINIIQNKRKKNWNMYYNGLIKLENEGIIQLPKIPDYAEHNASIFYLVCKNSKQRNNLIAKLSTRGIMSAFHYQPLHLSPYYTSINKVACKLKNAEKYGECLIRLPLHPNLSEKQISYIISETIKILMK